MTGKKAHALTIPGRLPGYNELTHGHWAARQRVKDAAMMVVGWRMREARLQMFTGKVTVEIRCYEKDARRDDDNVTSGAAKVILDAMQKCGILANDNQKHVRCVKHPVEVDRKNPRVEIIIEEIK